MISLEDTKSVVSKSAVSKSVVSKSVVLKSVGSRLGVNLAFRLVVTSLIVERPLRLPSSVRRSSIFSLNICTVCL